MMPRLTNQKLLVGLVVCIATLNFMYVVLKADQADIFEEIHQNSAPAKLNEDITSSTGVHRHSVQGGYIHDPVHYLYAPATSRENPHPEGNISYPTIHVRHRDVAI